MPKQLLKTLHRVSAGLFGAILAVSLVLLPANVAFATNITPTDTVLSVSSQNSPATNSGTISSLTNGMLVCRFASQSNALTISSATWNGTSMTFITRAQASGGGQVELWYLQAPASGTHDLVVTWSGDTGGAGSISCESYAYTGVPEASGTNVSVGNVTTIDVTVTVATNAAWLIGGYTNNGCIITGGAGSNTFYRIQLGNTELLIDTNGNQTTGSKTMTVSCPSGSARMAIVAASFPNDNTPPPAAAVGAGIIIWIGEWF